MNKGCKQQIHDTRDLPWYWHHGLHDAHILSVVSYTLNKFIGSKYIRTCVEILIDSSYAMFDTTVTSLKFYNCKVLTPHVEIEDGWWKFDRVFSEQGKNMVEINILRKGEAALFAIRFDSCEILRDTGDRGQGDGSVVPLSLTKSDHSHTIKQGDKDAEASEKEKQ